MEIFEKNYAPYVTVGVLSLLISLWIIGFNNPPLPPDGVFYITIAKQYLQHGIQSAFQLFRWPFYPILIASFSKFTGLSLLTAAHLIDAFALVLMALVFIKLIETLGGSRNQQWIGVAVVLAFPMVNRLHYTPVLRDFGYWAFMLLSVSQVLCFFKTKKLIHVLSWTCSIGIATLFRTEGVLFWYATPLVLFFQPGTFKERLKDAVTLVLPSVFLLLGGMIYLFGFHPAYFDSFETLRNWITREGFGISSILNNINSSQSFYEHFLLFVRTTYQILRTIIATFYGIFLIFIYFGMKAFGKKRHEYNSILILYLALNVFCYYFFAYANLAVFGGPLLPERYVVPYALLLLIYAPFGITFMYEHYYKHSSLKEPVKWVLPSLIVVASLVAYHNIVRVGHIKHYFQQSGAWVAQHVPKKSPLYTNQVHILFYADRLTPDKLKVTTHAPQPTTKLLRQYRYFAVYFRRQEHNMMERWKKNKHLTLLKTYALKSRGQVFIFKKKIQ